MPAKRTSPNNQTSKSILPQEELPRWKVSGTWRTADEQRDRTHKRADLWPAVAFSGLYSTEKENNQSAADFGQVFDWYESFQFLELHAPNGSEHKVRQLPENECQSMGAS